MSLHHLGIAQFPVIYRPFSSPIASPRSIRCSSREDLTEDNKDVLIERLNDVVLRLSKGSALDDSTFASMHHKVDEIELLMREGSRPESLSFESGSPGGAREDDMFWGPRTPTGSFRMRLPDMVKTSPQPIPGTDITTSKATKIARDAEKLASQLSKSIAELQIRRQESDHIHDLLVTRAEKAAERILLLEYRIAEMEDDFDANQSELKFLRIQLQSIDAQCSQYVPRNADQELSASIMNWKVDWEDIDKRSKARREKCNLSAAHENDTESVVVDAVTPFNYP